MRYFRAVLARASIIAAGLSVAASGAAQSPLASAAATSSAAMGPAKHMLFRVRGRTGATVFLLGSVHLLTPESAKLPAEADSAFAHAKTIAFETNIDSLQMRAGEMLGRARFTGGATLGTALTPAGLAKADSLLKLYGLSVAQVKQFKPWFVSILMMQVAMQKSKFQAQYGVDMQLNARAKQAGKSIVGLEPVDLQMGIMDELPAADQEKMITMSSGPDSSARALEAVKDAWVDGDVVKLDSLLNRAAVESPTFFSLMVVDRNKSWIPKLEQLLDGRDDALVVVGAAHLVGDQGLVSMLRARGYVVEQM